MAFIFSSKRLINHYNFYFIKKLVLASASALIITGCQVSPSQPPKSVDLEVNSNTDVVRVYVAPEDDIFKTKLVGVAPLKTKILISHGSSDYNVSYDHPYSGYIKVTPEGANKISRFQDSFSSHVDFFEYKPRIEKELPEFSKETKVRIAKIAALARAAENSPKMFFSQKVSEIEGEINMLKIEDEKFKSSDFARLLVDMNSRLNASGIMGEILESYEVKINLVEDSLGL